MVFLILWWICNKTKNLPPIRQATTRPKLSNFTFRLRDLSQYSFKALWSPKNLYANLIWNLATLPLKQLDWLVPYSKFSFLQEGSGGGKRAVHCVVQYVLDLELLKWLIYFLLPSVSLWKELSTYIMSEKS